MGRTAPQRTVECTDASCPAMFFTEDQMYLHHVAKHQGPVYWAWISRRARGVYLAHVWEEEGAGDAWDAFPSEDEAKRWCAGQAERKRLPWVRDDKGDLVVEEFRP